jgi:Asp-tRNA(Asn)/Glu-tRNA(Gln) amidotransferase A subunit family amidase
MNTKAYNDRIAASKAGIDDAIQSCVDQYGDQGAEVVRETLRRDRNISADPAYIEELLAARRRMTP